jgi:hypothetical protein
VRPDPFDWQRISGLILSELEPRRLVERIAEDRRTRPDYPWTSLGFKRWVPTEMTEAEFDRKEALAKAQIHADPATSAALERLESLGFRYLLGTYDEPGVRFFHINVEHNPDAERRALEG